MPRIRRSLLVPEPSTNHCTWRSHGTSRPLDGDEARSKFRELLKNYKDRHGIQILSYCLMGTHPHIVCTSTLGQVGFSAFWQVVNGVFARWYNRRTNGRGQVVVDRVRSPRIQDDRHQLTVMRYGDMNPVRAGLARSAGAWQWSSHRHYAYGEPDALVTDAPSYLALGRTPRDRRRAYLHLFARPLVDEVAVHRADLVDVLFIGDPVWQGCERVRCEMGPSG